MTGENVRIKCRLQMCRGTNSLPVRNLTQASELLFQNIVCGALVLDSTWGLKTSRTIQPSQLCHSQSYLDGSVLGYTGRVFAFTR